MRSREEGAKKTSFLLSFVCARPARQSQLPGYFWDEAPQVENSYLRKTRHTSELLRASSTGLGGKASYSTFPTKEINRMAGTILVTPTNTQVFWVAKATINGAPPGIRVRMSIIRPRVTTACPCQMRTPLTTSRRLCAAARRLPSCDCRLHLFSHIEVPAPDLVDGRVDNQFHDERCEDTADHGGGDTLHHVGA